MNQKDKNKEESKKKTIKGEIKRMIEYYKKNKNLFLFIVISFILFLIFGYEVSLLNVLKNPSKKKKKKFNLKGGNIMDYKQRYYEIRAYLFDYDNFDRLKEKYSWKDSLSWSLVGNIIIVILYIFQSFILRPVKNVGLLIIILMAISGSFTFPFIIVAILLYYIVVKMKNRFFSTLNTKIISSKPTSE